MSLTKVPLLNSLNHSLVDEIIWGHRLRHSQTAWLLVLEMLNVAHGCWEVDPSNPLPDMGMAGAPEITTKTRIRFRNLLFSLNQKAAELAGNIERNQKTSDQAWEEWLTYAEEEYDAPQGADYSPLKERFSTFVQFERAIDLVRSTAISGTDQKKNAYSKFLFPFAPESLFWETGVKGGPGDRRVDITRNSFTRGGILLHIMLARSSSAPALRERLAAFLTRETQGRALVKQLQIPESSANDNPNIGAYLPYSSHPRFDLLGEDFVSIFDLAAPENDKFLWLVTLGALHLSLYHAETAATEYLNLPVPLDINCEILLDRNKSVIRQRSFDSISHNKDLARRAVEILLTKSFESPEWQAIISDAECPHSEKIDRACQFLLNTFKLRPAEISEFRDYDDLDDLRTKTIEFFRKRHITDFARVHELYGRQAGLVSSRRTNKPRYAPTDQLLQSLVLANVKHEMPIEEFLVTLYHRYGLIIGPWQQSAIAKDGKEKLAREVGGTAYKRNADRFEARLKSMGMLRRLSDSQPYVLNPLQPLE